MRWICFIVIAPNLLHGITFWWTGLNRQLNVGLLDKVRRLAGSDFSIPSRDHWDPYTVIHPEYIDICTDGSILHSGVRSGFYSGLPDYCKLFQAEMQLNGISSTELLSLTRLSLFRQSGCRKISVRFCE